MAGEMGAVGRLADADPSFSQMLKSIQVLLFLVPASAGFFVRSSSPPREVASEVDCGSLV
jgi:hypothetical protein